MQGFGRWSGVERGGLVMLDLEEMCFQRNEKLRRKVCLSDLCSLSASALAYFRSPAPLVYVRLQISSDIYAFG